MTEEKILKLCRFLGQLYLTPVQLCVMLLLPEGMTATEMAKALDVGSPTLHASIRSLRKRGYLVQGIHPKSKKAKALLLTARGAEFLKQVKEIAL